MSLPNTVILWVWKEADVLVLWVLTPLLTSHLIVGLAGLAGLGASPGWAIILAGGLVVALTGSS